MDINLGYGIYVVGIIVGNGVMFDGKYVGVVFDVDFVGYGFGGVVLLLDILGGFDFVINNVYEYDSLI